MQLYFPDPNDYNNSRGIFLLISRNTAAQQSYPPWVRLPPYRPPYFKNPPSQSNRQVYNPYMQTGSVQQFMSFSIHFDPLISRFSTDSYDTRNDGMVPGFNFRAFRITAILSQLFLFFRD